MYKTIMSLPKMSTPEVLEIITEVKWKVKDHHQDIIDLAYQTLDIMNAYIEGRWKIPSRRKRIQWLLFSNKYHLY
jgi:hypothetical protein